MKKTEKKANSFKFIITILIVIVLSLISFVGIFVKKNGNYKNIIEDYNLGMELTGNRTLIIKPDDSTKSITKDAEGKVVENATDEDKAKEGYTTEDVPANSPEILTEENFEKSKEIITKRLEKYKYEDFSIKQDKETGNIVLELSEKGAIDKVTGILNKQGKFEIKDSKTDEVLMDNSMIKDAKVMYNTTTSGTSVYLDIEFNKEGKEKLEQITTEYKKVEDNKTTEENTENSENSEENKEDKQEQKEIVMEIDESKILTTSFDEPITTGKLQLTVGKASKDTDTLNDYVEQARTTATLLSTGCMPVKYTIDTNKYIKADIQENTIKIALIVMAVVIVIITILLVLKFKIKGLIGAILAIGYMALTLLVIRYANVKVSINGIAALCALAVINYLFVIGLIRNSNKKDEDKEKLSSIICKYIISIIPLFIISITFTYASVTLLNSFGMILFWGIVLMIIYNSIFANIFYKK